MTETAKDLWHCIFCGKHGKKEDFLYKDGIYACDRCREYKGLEPCNCPPDMVDQNFCPGYVLEV